MARRHVFLPENTVKLREVEPRPPSLSSRRHLEDRIAIQHSEIQSLLVENQRLAATHVALKQELSVANQDLRQLSSTAAEIKAERDGEVREVYEKSLKVDAEARLVDAMMAELNQVRADVEKLVAVKKELTNELEAVEDDLEKSKADSKEVNAIKAEIETMRREIQRGRAAIEHEKKNHASNLEYSQAMEKSIISMAHQIERLRAELANAEKRARAAAAAANPSTGYAASYGSSEMSYGVSPYPNPYGMHQVQGGVDFAYQCVGGVGVGVGAGWHKIVSNETQTSNQLPSTN